MTPKPNPWCLRAVDFTPITDEERAASGDTGDGRSLDGYAAVFDTPTEINSWEGKFSEQIARGAFRKTLAERMPVLQFDHGHDARTGTVPIGAFTNLTEDKRGLRVQARLFDNPVVEPIRQAIEGGAISGMSFRFQVTRDQWRDKNGTVVKPQELADGLLWNPGDRGPLQRTIKEVKLMEAGPVVFPAYPQTTVGVRSMTEADRAAIAEEYARTAMGQSEDDGDDYRDSLDEMGLTEENSDSKKPYGDVTYADPGYQPDGKKRYPLDTKDHAKAAWSYINMPKDADKYTSDQLSKIKAKIKAALKKFGVDTGDDGKNSDGTETDVRAAEPGTDGGTGEARDESEATEAPGTPPAVEGTSSGYDARTRKRKLFLMDIQTRKAVSR